ncbi:MAG: DegT/DnrJ/EryC1/StrS family aminotransferase [Candidatus Eisenbacteria bacterium]|uniref:DegT/DnrJ/EryC1/StrS family aminotransferase n=1 Tax=Eiseniibacteriota bacterium TaxID=2212470 RepID=A0A538T113_UNCEI|nr:MAG: DegT/DnrJ/EryC1/StrS family aminotransferase [Candidatus Eisenbacteria bacterium]
MRTSLEPPVPLLDLGAVHGPLEDELTRDFERVLRSGQFILGPEHDAFETELAVACGVEHAIGIASGTAALSIALLALGLEPGDEVIVPAFTYFASASAVTSIGARPVFVDVEPERMGLNPAEVEAAITPRTRAIMAVHLYGLCCELDPLLELAARHSIPLLEDAAQAIGATDRGRPVGTASAGATLSFFPTKNLGGLGDGGAILTRDSAFASRARLLRVHGDAGNYSHVALGTNARLDALQAAFLRTKLRRLHAWTEARRAIAARYRQGLAGSPVGLPPELEIAKHTYHQYTIRAPMRDRLQTRLRERGIATRVYYPGTVPGQPCFAHLGYEPGAFPVSERLTREVLSLPIYPGLTMEQVDRVAREVRSFYAGAPAAEGIGGSA